MAAPAGRIATIMLTTMMVLGVITTGASAASHESDALALLNAERAADGRAPVEMHSDLTDDALAWSEHMFAEGSLSHNPALASVTTGWDKLGENVGVGVSVASLHDAFMKSSSHRGNILGDYDYVGIAVVEETASKLWITVVFMKQIGSNPPDEAKDDPEPYATQTPAVAGEQPIAAAPATAPFVSAPAPATPAVVPVATIAFVQGGVAPIAD